MGGVLIGAEGGILSEGVAQVHAGMGNPHILPVRIEAAHSFLLVSLCW